MPLLLHHVTKRQSSTVISNFESSHTLAQLFGNTWKKMKTARTRTLVRWTYEIRGEFCAWKREKRRRIWEESPLQSKWLLGYFRGQSILIDDFLLTNGNSLYMFCHHYCFRLFNTIIQEDFNGFHSHIRHSVWHSIQNINLISLKISDRKKNCKFLFIWVANNVISPTKAQSKERIKKSTKELCRLDIYWSSWFWSSSWFIFFFLWITFEKLW